MVHVKQQREANAVVLEFAGAFDGRAVEELVAIALQQPVSCALVIDLSRASTVYDSALGALRDSLPKRGHRVRGILGRHQRAAQPFFENESDDVPAHTD